MNAMKVTKWFLVTAAFAVFLLTGTAVADWDRDDPFKWLQLPDLSERGLDVRVGKAADNLEKKLADDFLCTQTGPITSVHIWGSWRGDVLPVLDDGTQDPSLIDFRLSLHSDIPEDPNNPDDWSMPADPPLWEGDFPTGTFRVREIFAPNIVEEGWYDPNQTFYDPQNHIRVFQYNFDLTRGVVPPPVQEGTPENPVVYWLDVSAAPRGIAGVAPPEFGWKTSFQHWNDDAVWRDETGPFIDWRELRYPFGHPMETESIDLAFVIVPEPATLTLLALSSLWLLVRRRR